MSKDLRGLGAFETTQYIRGTLFIMVDYVLGYDMNGDAALLDHTIVFLYKVIDFTVKYLTLLPTMLK